MIHRCLLPARWASPRVGVLLRSPREIRDPPSPERPLVIGQSSSHISSSSFQQVYIFGLINITIYIYEIQSRKLYDDKPTSNNRIEISIGG